MVALPPNFIKSLMIRQPLSQTPAFSYAVRTLQPRLNLKKKSPHTRRIRKDEYCRAALSQDAPLAIAIGACVLNSLVFPITASSADSNDSPIDSTDARFAVMGIISFIPYFNWLSWVFAWLDTRDRRYAVYSIVYLAPYLRSNLSLSPEESWLPVASIIFCILHIQLEVSTSNGDFEGFQVLNEAAKKFSTTSGKNAGHSRGEEMISGKGPEEGCGNLPCAEERAREEIRPWRVPSESELESQPLNKDSDKDEGKKHQEHVDGNGE